MDHNKKNTLFDSFSELMLGISSEDISDMDRRIHLAGNYEDRIRLGYMIMSYDTGSVEDQSENFIDRLGWANYKNGDGDIAIIYIIKGVEMAIENGLFYLAAKGERHLAGIERHRGNRDEFLCHLGKSYKYTEQIQNASDKTVMEGNLNLLESKYYLEQIKDLSRAEEKANNAKTLFSNDPTRQVKVYSVLGKIYYEREDWDQAYNEYFEGYTKSKGVRKDERAANALGLSEIHGNIKAEKYYDLEKAKEYRDEANSDKSD